MDILGLVSTSIQLATSLMKLIPNYDQRKKEKFHKLKEKYEEERLKNYPNRDDNLLDTYRDDLLRFITDFSTEIY